LLVRGKVRPGRAGVCWLSGDFAWFIHGSVAPHSAEFFRRAGPSAPRTLDFGGKRQNRVLKLFSQFDCHTQMITAKLGLGYKLFFDMNRFEKFLLFAFLLIASGILVFGYRWQGKRRHPEEVYGPAETPRARIVRESK
jgi:hypothetical protein